MGTVSEPAPAGASLTMRITVIGAYLMGALGVGALAIAVAWIRLGW